MNSIFKILGRDISRNKVFFLIKILGLTIGLTCFILIFLFVQYEKSYDSFHDGYKNIYRVVVQRPENLNNGTDIYCTTPGPLVPLIKEDFPEISYATRVFKRKRLVTYDKTTAIENRVLYVDPDFLKLFSFKLLTGNPNEALNNPNSIILTKSSVEKYFGNENPIGKTLQIDENIEYIVTGVIENQPDNSHIKFDFLSTISTSLKYDRPSYKWGSSPYQTYIRFKNVQSEKTFANRLNTVVDNERDNQTREHFLVQALADIHLNGNFNDELEKNGDKKQVYAFFMIGIFILLIASFNYANLSSAHSLNRLKTIGIRKVVGAKRHHLFFQFIEESSVYVLASTIIALVLVYISLPYLNSFIQKEIPFSFILKANVFLGILLFVIVTSLFSGLFPAAIITKLNPVEVLKNNIQASRVKFISIRSSFVVVQFVISMILVTGTLSIVKQLKYLQNKNLGYQKENIITTFLNDENSRSKYQIFKNELLKNSGILDVTVSNYLPNDITGQTDVSWDGQNPGNGLIYYAQVGNNFLDFYGIHLKAGNTFTEAGSSKANFYILNQTAVKSFGLKNAVGSEIKINGINSKVVGEINDINYSSLYFRVASMAFMNLNESDYKNKARLVSIKISPQNFDKTIFFIKNTYAQFSPNYPFSYSFLDSTIEQVYLSERHFESLIRLFSVIAIFISCLGLFGLAKYNLEKKVKEIGIRKVNGAKISEVMVLLNKDFAKWVVVAFVIATPVSYYAMNKWLENFAYKTNLSWWIFALAGVLALGIALLTVSWQSWRAATRNPVEALRYE
jgi:putative ABC transport system permease protein